MILTKICLLSAILGIILMIIIADKIDIPNSNIDSIKKEDVNKDVKIKGLIKKAINNNKVAVIELMDKTGSIEVVLFKPQNLILKKGSLVEIEGKVSIKEDSLQIYAETAKVVN